MCAFYGWTLEYARSLDIEDLHNADLAVRVLDAQKRITDSKIALLSNMKAKDREAFLRALHRMAYPKEEQEVTVATNEQILEMFNVRR